VATCDLDQPMIFGQTPFQFPIHLGHECVAEDVEGPEAFTAGDRVVVPFQISCGTCERCRRETSLSEHLLKVTSKVGALRRRG
jgi:alcohol dehydrogenase